MRHMTSTSVALVAAFGLAACGDGDTAAPPQASESASGDVVRYCALTRELDAAGTRFFARLEQTDASPARFAAAERRFIRKHARELGEIERVAPAQIRRDVRVIIAAMRKRGGLEPGIDVSQRRAQAAERRVKRLERERCAGG